MKKLSLSLVLITLFLTNIIQAQVASSLLISDTRSVNDLPNASYNGIKADFKSRAIIGVPGQGVWSTNLTFSQWTSTDNTGDKNHQLNFNNGGIFYRNAYPLDSQWGTWRQILMENESGNVGIGTIDPTNKLDIKGDIAIGSGSVNLNTTKLFVRNPAGKTWAISSGSNMVTESSFSIYNWSDNQTQPFFHIDFDGNIGIGTVAPDSKLTVNGKIHAQEVRIDLASPMTKVPDYVFANDYKLKSLQEVEEFIKQNSHLPEIPSAKEIEKNGLMLAEMNMSLLKKIEELTLYSIEQEKNIKFQNSKIIELEKQNEKLLAIEKRLEKIEMNTK